MKRFFVSLLLAAALLLPGMVKAEGTGLYLAPKFLLSIQSTGPIERSSAMAGSGVGSYNQFTLGGALALGYDFWPEQMLPLRTEIEFALRANSRKNWSDRGVNLSEVKGTWNNSTLFANLFWDFHNDTAVTPYVGAGIGLAFTYAGYDFKDNNGNRFSADDRFTNFAWNAGAGLAYNINENFTLDASYRFVGLGYNQVSATSNSQKYEIGNRPYNNEFMFGLRYGF